MAPAFALVVTKKKITLVWTMDSRISFLTKSWCAQVMYSPSSNSSANATMFGRCRAAVDQLKHRHLRSQGRATG